MSPKNKVKIYVYLTLSLFLVIGLITGFSYAYWLKHFEQRDENIIVSSCFELTITNEANDITLTNAIPISDEEGLELVPYTFRINNICDVYGYVNISLEVMELEEELKEILPEHIHVSLHKSGIELYNDILKDDNLGLATLPGATKSYLLNRQYMKAKTYEDYALRIWLDKGVTNDDLDTIGGSFKSKVNIVFEQTEPLFELNNTILGRREYENSFKSLFWNYYKTISDIIIEDKLEPKVGAFESWDVSRDYDGSVMAYLIDNGDETQTLYLQGNGGIKMPENCSQFFEGFYLSSKIQNIELLDFSNVTTVDNMFRAFGRNSTSNISLDFSSLNTDNLINMDSFLAYLGYNTEKDINVYFGNDFNANKVSKMSQFLFHVGYKANEINVNLGNNFNAQSVIEPFSMFYDVGNSAKKIIINFGNNFNIKNAIKLSNFFYYVGVNSKYVDINLGNNFNCENVLEFLCSFQAIGQKAEYLRINLGDNFNAQSAISMNGMFYTTGINSSNAVINLGDNFNSNSVTNLSQMLQETKALVDISKINFANATLLTSFGYGSPNLYGHVFIDYNITSDYGNSFEYNGTRSENVVYLDYTTSTESLVDSYVSYTYNRRPLKGILLNEHNITINDDSITSSLNKAVRLKKVVLSTNLSNKAIKSFKVNGTLVNGSSFTMPDEDAIITDIVLEDCYIVESEHNPYANNIDYETYYENTFTGATSITVQLTYQTESTGFDWVYLYTDPSTIYNNRKYGGTTKTTETITLTGDYIKIVFRTDGSGNNYYGFKAVIIPNYD